MYENNYSDRERAMAQDDWESEPRRHLDIVGTNPWEWPVEKVELLVLLCRLLNIEFTVVDPNPGPSAISDRFMLSPWNFHSKLRRAKNYELT